MAQIIQGDSRSLLLKEIRYLPPFILKTKRVNKMLTTDKLIIIETQFGKMARTFLNQICVQSKGELKERILRGIAEINEFPIVHRWEKFNFDSAF